MKIYSQILLTKHDAETAAPAFGEADADDFHVARKIALKGIGGGMKAEGGRDQINKRRRGLEFDAREIAVAREVSLRLMPANAVRGLEGEIDVFGGFEFQNGEAAAARDAQ
jgi:hypothetical protein